jgi:uncharacterized protein (TIGR02246 family)
MRLDPLEKFEEPSMEADEREIRQLVTTWHQATAAGDVPAILQLMEEDVVFLTPGNPPMRGRGAFEKGLRALLQSRKISSASEIREIRLLGDWAYCWSHLSFAITPLGQGTASRRAGDVLTLLRKQSSGKWAVARDANMLAAEQSATT